MLSKTWLQGTVWVSPHGGVDYKSLFTREHTLPTLCLTIQRHTLLIGHEFEVEYILQNNSSLEFTLFAMVLTILNKNLNTSCKNVNDFTELKLI
jgi:hypothetical protein